MSQWYPQVFFCFFFLKYSRDITHWRHDRFTSEWPCTQWLLWLMIGEWLVFNWTRQWTDWFAVRLARRKCTRSSPTPPGSKWYVPHVEKAPQGFLFSNWKPSFFNDGNVFESFFLFRIFFFWLSAVRAAEITARQSGSVFLFTLILFLCFVSVFPKVINCCLLSFLVSLKKFFLLF